MTTDDMEIVSAVRTALADRVGRERFELWFGASTRLALNHGTLSIAVPNRFFQDWIRCNFRQHIESACLETLGKCPALEFRIDTTLADAQSEQTAPAAANAAAPPRQTTCSARGPEEPDCPGAGQAQRPDRRQFADLESFVPGETNRLALVSAEMAARQPGQITPLVIHGPTSVGKTHLLQGIWTAVRKSRRAVRAIYLSAEQFTSSFLEALRGSGLPSFRRKYRGVELLLFDDLQFLAGKRATQVELLHTIDELLHEGRQLVFAADRPPAELVDLGPELTTRLDGGMVCRIDPPDYATRLGIVAQMARRFGIHVPQDVQQFIASHLTSHAREISGALCRLQATSQAAGRPVGLEMAQEALSEMIRHRSRMLRLPDIEKAVCEVFGVDAAGLQSARKAKCVSHPRMLAMWLARKHTRAALSEIGQFFGRRSHSTVISAQKRIDDWMAAGKPVELADRAWKLDEAIRQVEKRLLVG